MKLIYYKGDKIGANFGDALNLWLWPKLLPDFFNDDGSELFLGIGTIIASWQPDDACKIVLGAGTSPEIVPRIDNTWNILAVRGPLTAQLLGVDATLAVTDPAILVSQFVQNEPQDRGSVTLVVHHARSKRANWHLACKLAGINCVDPHENIQKVITAIQGSRVVLAEAMHAAIVADSLRVPWIPVVMHDHINFFKWEDWCLSMKLKYRPVITHPLLNAAPSILSRVSAKIMPYMIATQLRRIAETIGPELSHDSVYNERKQQLIDVVGRLRHAKKQ
jgi:succinoglycan biosynthesis protein ExoV